MVRIGDGMITGMKSAKSPFAHSIVTPYDDIVLGQNYLR